MVLRLLLAVLLCQTAEMISDGEMELLFVQAIWRHGDRSPTKTYPTDPFQDGNWTFGGGGFGQLSPIGMKQHMIFGKLLRTTYVDSGFLSPRYSSKEIYVRSTDKNRTIISAMSNMLGMYGQDNNANVAGVDYPDEPGWPVGYVPIAIHTVDDDTDYIGNPDAVCPRQDQLWDMAKTSDELQEFQNRNDVLMLLANLTENCGEHVTIDNLWIIQDALMIEQIHANDTLRQVNEWFTDDLYNQMTVINDQVELYQNGNFNGTLMMNGLNIGLELLKLRGGSMINDLYMHMNVKYNCMFSTNANPTDCKWMDGVKYYVYSAHDTTIFAFFSIMGIVEKVIRPRGYPLYSAATFVELWLNHTDNKPYFKLSYHANDVNVTIYPITAEIEGCNGNKYCSLDVFSNFAATAKPDKPMDQWCNVNPNVINTTATTPGNNVTPVNVTVVPPNGTTPGNDVTSVNVTVVPPNGTTPGNDVTPVNVTVVPPNGTTPGNDVTSVNVTVVPPNGTTPGNDVTPVNVTVVPPNGTTPGNDVTPVNVTVVPPNGTTPGNDVTSVNVTVVPPNGTTPCTEHCSASSWTTFITAILTISYALLRN